MLLFKIFKINKFYYQLMDCIDQLLFTISSKLGEFRNERGTKGRNCGG